MKNKPIISWPGGKSRLARHILPLFSAHRCYVEPFCGGLGMFLSREVNTGTVEVINDFNGDLINLFRVVKYHKDAFLAELDLCLNSRENFRAFMAQPGLTDIQRGARWFMRRKNCFSGSDDSFPATLFFVDPPYVQAGGKDYKGWKAEQTGELASLLSRLKGQWVLTLDDSEANRKLFNGWEQTNLVRTCSTNNATSGPKDFRELIVCSNAVFCNCRVA